MLCENEFININHNRILDPRLFVNKKFNLNKFCQVIAHGKKEATRACLSIHNSKYRPIIETNTK